MARHLGFNENETKYFVSLVSSQHARSRKERERAQGVVESLAENSPVTVSKDHFELLKEWHHFAVLNLLNSVAEKRPLDAKAIAKRLGLPVGVVRQSMGLLEELGLMDENKDQRANGLVKTTQDLPSRAIKHHHKRVMERAIKSLQNDPVEDREFQSLMFLAPRSEINNMKKLLRKQSLQFLKKFESNHSEDLYSLSIQLVPVTKKGKKGSE